MSQRYPGPEEPTDAENGDAAPPPAPTSWGTGPDEPPRYGVRLPPDQRPLPPSGAERYPRPVPTDPYGTPVGPEVGGPYGQQGPYSQSPYGAQPGAYGQDPYGSSQQPYGQVPYASQQPYGQDPYGRAPYGQGPIDPYARRGGPGPANGLALWSLLLGLFTFMCGPSAIAGIVVGIMARRAVAQGRATNKGLATTGLVVSIVMCVLWLLAAYWLISSGAYQQILDTYQ